MRPVPLFWAVLALSGCAVGPVFTPPSLALSDRYSRLAPVTAPEAEDLAWWKRFEDPVLDRLIARAETESVPLAQARARLAEAKALALREGVAVSGSGSATYSSASAGVDQISVDANLSLNLAGSSGWRARAAKARLEAAEADAREAGRTLRAEIGIAYADLRFAQASLGLRHQDFVSRQRTLADMKTLIDAGEATQLDILRAEALVVETRAQIPALEAEVIRQRNRLSTLIGVPVGLEDLDLGYPGRQPLPGAVFKTGVPADLLRARPDIRAAERRYAAAVSDLGAAEAARYPSLTLSGRITAPVGGGSRAESLVAGLVLPLFNQPALAADAKAARARVDQAYQAWRGAVLSAVEEVETALAALAASNEQARQAGRLVALNQEALDLSRDLLSGRGEITVLDLLDRERALADARASRARALRERAVDYISLATALGLGH
jgi:multidrug efflux system outer membrane protein